MGVLALGAAAGSGLILRTRAQDSLCNRAPEVPAQPEDAGVALAPIESSGGEIERRAERFNLTAISSSRERESAASINRRRQDASSD